ncbi:hypothetical protein F5Y15DRAFT_317578 [Xylariaceae sp. FL0016]|nr:hypothetical protein F5Y15DRAFT_317578 [Xylariaceae sp. FL0016]
MKLGVVIRTWLLVLVGWISPVLRFLGLVAVCRKILLRLLESLCKHGWVSRSTDRPDSRSSRGSDAHTIYDNDKTIVFPLRKEDLAAPRHIIHCMFKFNGVLDEKKLQDSLKGLLSTKSWRKFGGRLRSKVNFPSWPLEIL